MGIRKSTETAPQAWSVADLGAFYTSHRSELHAHANRILKDSQKADEVIQESLVKFMLAATEIDSEQWALSYLHRTIENLCIDIFRAEGRRPNLVVLDDATAEVEATWQASGDHTEEIAAADDAAIVRQALALLSPAERTALVMWEMEGRSTQEIAAALDIKESAVRHTLSRARASLRRVLSELIIDEERGLTALDMLSTSYKKAAELAKKSSKVALSLVLLIAAFFGFHTFVGPTGNPVAQIPSAISQNSGDTVAKATTPSSSSPSASASAVAPEVQSSVQGGAFARQAKLSFPGLDRNGVPTGFTVVSSTNKVGAIFVSKNDAVATDSGATLSTKAMTDDETATNVLLNQVITIDASGTSYSTDAAVSLDGSWSGLDVVDVTTDLTHLDSGNYLLTAKIHIDSSVAPLPSLSTFGHGTDVAQAPSQIITRILLDGSKTKILAQAIQVIDGSKGAKP